MNWMVVRLLIFFLVTSNGYLLGQTWQQTQEFPGIERDDAVGFVIGNKGYVGTGLITGWQPTSDFYSLDLNTGSWNQVASLPPGNDRQYAIGFSDSGIGYVFGGVRGTNFLRDLWSYNPGTNDWNLKTSLPGKSRAGATGFVTSNKFYLIGGVDSSNVILDEVWIYDISLDQWSQAASSMPIGLWRASAAEHIGNGYVIFGKDNSGNISNSLYQYQPNFDSWNYITSFPDHGRTYASLTAIDSNLVVFGGLDSSNTSYEDLWLFDFTNWIQKPSIPAAPRRGGILLPYLWDVYYTTGINNQNIRLKETWRLSSVTDVINTQKEEIKLYPNPAKDHIQISGLLHCKNFEILNSLSVPIKQGAVPNNGIIDISDLSDGLYLLKCAERIYRFIKVS